MSEELNKILIKWRNIQFTYSIPRIQKNIKDEHYIYLHYEDLCMDMLKEIERLNNVINQMNTNNNDLNEKQCYCSKGKLINDLLKRISNLEFDVEEKGRRIDKAIEYMQEALECGYHGLDLTFDKLVNNTTDILEGSDKE